MWGVGVDADQGYLGSYVLTSALKRVDTAVYDSIKDAKDGDFKGGTDAVYGIDVNGVGIGKFSPKAPAGIAAEGRRRSSSRSRPARSRTSRRSSSNAMAQISKRQAEMLRAGKHFGVVGTVGGDGRPQTSVVWVDWDGEHVVFNTTNKRAKGRNLRASPRVSISVWDNDDPYRYFEVEGPV